MSVRLVLAPTDDDGRILAMFGPEHIMTTRYVRDVVRLALEVPEDDRRRFWVRRRSHLSRKLHEAGLTDDEVAEALRSFNARCRLEADARRLIQRVEAETAASGGDP